AAQAYRYVIENSNNPELVARSRVALLQIEYEQIIRHYPVNLNEMRSLEKRYVSTLEEAGTSPLAFPLMRNLAHIRAFYLGNTRQAIEGLETLISYSASDPLMQAESKLELADIMLFTGEPWEASLLYSQVDKAFKNEPIGHEARFRGARLSFYLGEFEWARAQLNVLKAATSKLIANDAMALSLLISDNIGADSSTTALSAYAAADLLLFRNHTREAMAILDSMLTAFPGHEITDDVLLKRAEINVSQGNFAKAADDYLRIAREFSDGVLADDALFKLGVLYQDHIKDKEKAMEAFQRLLLEHPGSIFVIEARKRFRNLRGDSTS
ncbi:MAG: tetratricopeptide repeat protein, partial [Lentimicrobiaceae bacterium]|nr:tetratricopeptide repeat protein [Lentimicrobiaceae bacterium]